MVGPFFRGTENTDRPIGFLIRINGREELKRPFPGFPIDGPWGIDKAIRIEELIGAKGSRVISLAKGSPRLFVVISRVE
jgi:hypothetical protein